MPNEFPLLQLVIANDIREMIIESAIILRWL